MRTTRTSSARVEDDPARTYHVTKGNMMVAANSTHRSFKLSVLDQSPMSADMSTADALSASLQLAKAAERLGYHRYWAAEHHASPALACTSPEILLAAAAQHTSTIRLGSGGIMLPHYSPLKVAQNFKMLDGLAPGRIDLGVGRAPGSDQRTAFALQRDRRQRSPDDFVQALDELLAYTVPGLMPEEHPFARYVQTTDRRLAEPFLLGSSPQSGIWAAELGLPYVFADFINPSGAAIVAQYRANFQPSAVSSKPYVIVTAWAFVAETDEAAARVSASHRVMIDALHMGRLIPVPSPDEAVAELLARGVQPGSAPAGRRTIVGSPAKVRSQIESLADEYKADEVMIVAITHSPEDRLHSYELLADAFSLNVDHEIERRDNARLPQAGV